MANGDLADPVFINTPGFVGLDLALVDETNRCLIEKLPSAGKAGLAPLATGRMFPVVRLGPDKEFLNCIIELPNQYSPTGAPAFLESPPIVQFHFLRSSLVS